VMQTCSERKRLARCSELAGSAFSETVEQVCVWIVEDFRVTIRCTDDGENLRSGWDLNIAELGTCLPHHA